MSPLSKKFWPHNANSSGVIFKPIQFDLSSARNGLVIACILRDLCDIFMMSLRCYISTYIICIFINVTLHMIAQNTSPLVRKNVFGITLMAHDCHDICFNLRPFHIFFKSKRFVEKHKIPVICYSFANHRYLGNVLTRAPP